MTRLVTCRTALASAATTFRIIPAGRFRANDGRPDKVSSWLLNASAAARIAAEVASRAQDVLIDYEHASLRTSNVPTPAAGWFNRVAWRENDGLYAADVRWTAAARSMIEAGEYRYISPVFTFNNDSGEVIGLHSAGLTNRPALDGLTVLLPLSALSADSSRRSPSAAGSDPLHHRAREMFKRAFGMDLDAELAQLSTEAAQLRMQDDAAARAATLADPNYERTRAMFKDVFGMDLDAELKRSH